MTAAVSTFLHTNTSSPSDSSGGRCRAHKHTNCPAFSLSTDTFFYPPEDRSQLSNSLILVLTNPTSLIYSSTDFLVVLVQAARYTALCLNVIMVVLLWTSYRICLLYNSQLISAQPSCFHIRKVSSRYWPAHCHVFARARSQCKR